MRTLAAALTLVGAVAGAPSLAAGTAPPGWATVHDRTHGISISFPSPWRAARSTLTPVLVDPVVPIAVSTYRMEPQRLGECDIIPQRALEAMGKHDAFLAVYVFDGMATWSANTTRPTHFSRQLPWYDGGIQCTQHVRGWTGQLTFSDHGRNLAILVAIGSKASDARRRQLYKILDTLTVDGTRG
jgi:hypothetical protein